MGMSYEIIVFSFVCILFNNATSNFTETDLHKHLFEKYNANVMPRDDVRQPITIGIEMFLMSVDEINEKHGTITVTAFLELNWKDRFLQWPPEKYSNVTGINVKVGDIWRPDITLDNTYDKPSDFMDKEGNAIIDNDGNVVMWPYSTYTVACRISIAKFPFDRQNCTFDFLSWTNPSSTLSLVNKTKTIGLAFYRPNGEWTLLDGTVRHWTKPYGEDHWDHVEIDLELSRKSLFVVVNVIVPILCIAFLNCFSFILPVSGGERVTYSISLFLTLAVFMTIVNGSLPESSDEISMFGVYLGLQLIGSGLTIVITIVALHVFYKSAENPVGKLPRYFTRLLCVKFSYTEVKSLQFFPKIKTISHNETNGDHHDQRPINEQDNEEELCTWQMVSGAIDRLSFFVAISWHAILLVILVVKVML